MAGPSPREDMDGVLDQLNRFAQDQLGKRGSFLPFGAAVQMTATGSMSGSSRTWEATRARRFTVLSGGASRGR